MPVRRITRDPVSVLNHCTRHLARTTTDPRHDFGQYDAGDYRARVAEAWRFPLIETAGVLAAAAGGTAGDPPVNEVTFVFADASLATPPRELGVVGTFGALHEVLPLAPLSFEGEPMPFRALTVLVPKAQVHRYLFLADGEPMLDPINPQRVTLENGRTWSRFFTEGCSQPLSLEPWELALLARLTAHILPFRTVEGQRALAQGLVEKSFLLDESIGAVNFIDKLIAREENHYLDDYKICLAEIDRLLRQRNPFVEPAQMPKGMFVELYDQMAANVVPGWNRERYGEPRFFLQLLRRHTYTGAFSHPRHGGNAMAAGWTYLEARFRDPATGGTLFDWRRSLERPLGNDPDYRG